MTTPPPSCAALGRQCRELELTLHVADLSDDGPVFHDAVATWLLGHTERITFGHPYARGERLLVDATVHVPCKYLRSPRGHGGSERCAAHGFAGSIPPSTQPGARARLRERGGRYTVVQDGEVRTLELASRSPSRRALPTLQTPNPCVGAPCRTADNQPGAACCRDLTIDVVLADQHQAALLRSRAAPYLCNVSPAKAGIVECEVISACGYLEGDALQCSLHDRVRPDGSPAKPSICSEWPDLEPGDAWHPGCRLVNGSRAS